MTTKAHCRRGHDVVIPGQVVCLECNASTLTLGTRLAAPFRAAADHLPLLPPGDELPPMVVSCLSIIGVGLVVLLVPDIPWWGWVLAAGLLLNAVERIGVRGTYYAAMFLLFVVGPLIFFPWAVLAVMFGWY